MFVHIFCSIVGLGVPWPEANFWGALEWKSLGTPGHYNPDYCQVLCNMLEHLNNAFLFILRLSRIIK